MRVPDGTNLKQIHRFSEIHPFTKFLSLTSHFLTIHPWDNTHSKNMSLGLKLSAHNPIRRTTVIRRGVISQSPPHL